MFSFGSKGSQTDLLGDLLRFESNSVAARHVFNVTVSSQILDSSVLVALLKAFVAGLMVNSVCGSGLHKLPNELLFNILEHIYRKESSVLRVNAHAKFSVLWTLSRVSRRLRAITLPLLTLFRQLKFRKLEEFTNFLVSVAHEGENKYLASSVRLVI